MSRRSDWDGGPKELYEATQHDHDCGSEAQARREEHDPFPCEYDPFPCEYDPVRERAAFNCQVHAAATWVLGHDEAWRLCTSCADLPEFRRFRVRRVTREDGEARRRWLSQKTSERYLRLVTR